MTALSEKPLVDGDLHPEGAAPEEIVEIIGAALADFESKLEFSSDLILEFIADCILNNHALTAEIRGAVLDRALITWIQDAFRQFLMKAVHRDKDAARELQKEALAYAKHLQLRVDDFQVDAQELAEALDVWHALLIHAYQVSWKFGSLRRVVDAIRNGELVEPMRAKPDEAVDSGIDQVHDWIAAELRRRGSELTLERCLAVICHCVRLRLVKWDPKCQSETSVWFTSLAVQGSTGTLLNSELADQTNAQSFFQQPLQRCLPNSLRRVVHQTGLENRTLEVVLSRQPIAIELLWGLKEWSKQQFTAPQEHPDRLHNILYLACLASGIVHHRVLLSRTSPQEVAKQFLLLRDRRIVKPLSWLTGLLANAIKDLATKELSIQPWEPKDLLRKP